jgi:Flp pilus assembly protein TadG
MPRAKQEGVCDRSLRALLRGAGGTTALEFAILCVPFFMFTLFLFEIGMDFYIQLALDYAVQQGGRKLQTGAGNAATSATVFKTDCLCPAVAGFLNCSQISLTVYPLSTSNYYTNGQAGAGSVPISGGKLSTASWSFSTGGPSTLMYMQAIYTSVSIVGGFVPGMSTASSAGRVRVTTSAVGFINEGFTAPTTICGASS